MALDLRSSELEHVFIKDRISNVEKHFSDISSKMSTYIKKLAHLRDSGDDLAKCITLFASKENLNKSVRTSLGEFSDILKAIQEYRDAKIQRIEVKVVLELSHYSPLCKTAKSDLKKGFEARERVLNKKNNLEKARAKNPTNWQKIAQAEKEVCEAQDEAAHASQDLCKKIDSFEKRKIEDIQNVFLDFIKIELIFHAKAIELYTLAFNKIKDIQVEEDVKEFRDHFRACSAPLNESTFLQSSPRHIVPDQGTSVKSSLNPCHESTRSILTSRSSNSRIETDVSVDSGGNSKFEFGDH